MQFSKLREENPPNVVAAGKEVIIGMVVGMGYFFMPVRWHDTLFSLCIVIATKSKEGFTMKYLVAYVSTTIIFLAIDALWLGFVAKNFYAEQLGDLMAKNIKFQVAAVFYLVYTVGIVVFAIAPALEAEKIFLALGYGALFGFLAYGTYDFTNMATIRNWPTIVSVVDIIWGTFITSVSATLGYLLTRFFS